MKNEQLFRLNSLRSDFMKWADSNEPSVWELDINKIGGYIKGYTREDEPVVLLDCNKNKGDWYLCINTNSENEISCYPIADMTDDKIYEIRRIVESWLFSKDMGNLFI